MNVYGDSNSQVITANPETKELYSDILPPLSLRVTTLQDQKEYQSFIKNVVRLVRASYEYRLWTGYVKDTLGHNFCALTGEVADEVTVEIHHHPFTLYDICETILNHYITNGLEFCSMDIAIRVLELHYENRVGYIPLCKTLHEKYHNGALTIPINLVHGDWKYLLEHYSPPQHIYVKVMALSQITTSNHRGWKKDEYQITEHEVCTT